jgi:pimeloyl-ACP methyl ester carboxylesterase
MMQSTYCQLPEFRAHVLRAGQGKPLVLLHGWPEFASAYRKLIPLLADQFSMIAPDFRGFGLSENPNPEPYPVTAELLARDTLAVMDALEIHQADFVSHDVGSNIAQYIAIHHPERVRRLFFFSVTHPGIGRRWIEPDHYSEIWYQAFNRLPWATSVIGASPASIRAYIGDCLSRWASSPDAFEAVLDEWVDVFGRPGVLQGGFNWYIGSQRRRLAMIKGEIEPSRIPHPTYVLWGADDPVIPARWADTIGDWFDNVEVELAPQAGHFVHWEQPNLAANRIRAFLGGHCVG